MSIRMGLGVALAALFIAGCEDVSQKKPETAADSSATSSVFPVTPRPAAMQPPVAAAVDEAAGERSSRLFGRGIDRERQTRI